MNGSYNPFALNGKNVLVTGASSGIGRQTAIECSRLGARLVLTGRDETRLNETLSGLEGNGHRAIAADVTTSEGVERIIASCDTLNGAVLCAGISVSVPFKFASQDKFNKVFDTNFFAPVELTRALVMKKKIAAGGSIVFVSSIGGLKVFEPGNSIYGASKAALASISKYCAKEFAPKIRVNSVHPGMIETPMTQAGVLSEEQLEIYKQNYLLQRFGRPEEVAFGIVYLLSDASSFVTSSQLYVDGGQ